MPIHYEQDSEHVVLITIDRPEARNSCDLYHFRDLADRSMHRDEEHPRGDPSVIVEMMAFISEFVAQRRARPEGFRVVYRGVQFHHVSAGHYFVKHGERRWTTEIGNALVLLLLCQRDFHFHFPQTFDQSLHTRRPQCLD